MDTKITTTNKKRKVILPLRYQTYIQQPLLKQYRYEIAVDEAGRGPLFGRVYVGAIVYHPDFTENQIMVEIKDSKKFTNKKTIENVATWIKSNVLAWSVQYVEADRIDTINIRNAVHEAMHSCIRDIVTQLSPNMTNDNTLLVIDGSDFTPYTYFDNENDCIGQFDHVTLPQGDALVSGIAGASILAKVERDSYILELCKQYPVLSERYGIHTNMGYGTKTHLDGIRKYGITPLHRKTFGAICKNASVVLLSKSE